MRKSTQLRALCKYLVLRVSAHLASSPLAQVASNLHCLSCAASGGFWIHHDISSPAPGLPRRTSTLRTRLLDIYIPGTSPSSPPYPLPLSASVSGHPRSLARKPHLGHCSIEGFCLCSMVLTSGSVLVLESWRIPTPRPIGWTSCAFE